jgi:hypothetical protein
MVVKEPLGIDRQAVDGEVAPLGIAYPITAKRDLRLSAEGFGILAQRRDLEGVSVDHKRHRAVLDAGRHALDARGPGAADDFIRQSRMSISPIGRSSNALRTAPPTTRASSPSALSSLSTRAARPVFSHGA